VIEVSNSDMSNVVVFLRAYQSTEHHGSTREINKRRRAGLLAEKIEKRLNRIKK
jgi:hypothetical protein